MKYTTIINGEQYEVEIQRDGSVLVNGNRHDVDFLELGSSLYSIIKDNRSLELAIDEDQNQYEILMDGRLYEGQVLDQRAMLMMNRKGGLKLGTGEVTSPMPGLIIEVLVAEGDTVTEGQTVVILESMKMQNELKAPRDGVVLSVNTEPDVNVDKDALLVVVGDADEE
jgi:biotin carboxyl carrier protein